MAAVKADVLTVDEKIVISDEKLDQIKKELPETCPTEKEIEVVFEKAQATAKAAADAAEQRIKLSLLALAVAVTLN